MADQLLYKNGVPIGKTYNNDIYGLARRINRFTREMFNSNSANYNSVDLADMLRFETFTAALLGYHDWFQAQPKLDTPETGKELMALSEKVVVPVIANESIYDLCVLMQIMHDELVSSDSSRRATNMEEYDSLRFNSYLARINSLMTEYIQSSEPLDQPQTSPNAEMNTNGRSGV